MIVVRPGAEEAIKSGRTRQFWREKLRDSIADALTRGGIEHELRLSFGRIFVATPRVDEALGILPYVFGVSTFSPVRAVAPAEMDEIVRIGKEACHGTVRGRTYAVRCGRQGGHSFSSVEVERTLGAALNEGATVDLDNPEVTVRVEVLGGRAVITEERRQGAGGLPAGMQGRALALLSGGYDSAVAAWRTMRRGVELDLLLCNLGGAAQERMVLQVAKFLYEAWGHGQQSRFHVLDFRPVMEDIRAHIRPGLWQVALKRQMYRAGCRVAAETKAEALVTGEAIGQVSSQTLGNLQAIEPVADRPVLRPLLGFDKQEILDAARAIGTAPLSERVRETCALAGGRPAVRSRPGTLERAEAALDPALLAHGVEGRKVLDLRKVTPDELRQPYLFVRDISEDAVVIDCQPRHMYRAWHAPGAEHWEADRLARDYRRLPREKTYVLYCTFGTQTPVLAELMQQAGYEAYAFEGGLSRVQACVEGKETEAVRRAV
ncbi:tRNA 4-thiouridine(8) synthase ThiI [Ferruginivarius sediminum]|uniref:tRNA sulfurtransferase n=2 Tax=Ferruginivarius sediminum TaxID=2661937 RepID=A0A369T9M8_9PROT|nr:tRNA 4-thiouridine(8) synthase ThiI [Ferruginivarius sediminum]